MRHLLPLSLGKLADHAGETTRYSTAGVHLQIAGDGTFTAEATDTRTAVHVTGPCADPTDYPDIPAITAAPNGDVEALVPAGVWKKAFQAATKLISKKKRVAARLKAVAVAMGDDTATFAATDLEQTLVESTRTVSGKFPKVSAVLPDPDTARDRFEVDPLRLAELLKTAAVFAESRGMNHVVAQPVVTIETRGPRVITVRCVSPDGLQFVGAMMTRNNEDLMPAGSAEAWVEQLREEKEALEAKLYAAQKCIDDTPDANELHARCVALADANKELESQRKELQAELDELRPEVNRLQDAADGAPHLDDVTRDAARQTVEFAKTARALGKPVDVESLIDALDAVLAGWGA